jgi:CBS domain containing-hemolysin-like protein
MGFAALSQPIYGLLFEIVDMDGRRVDRVLIQPVTAQPKRD